MKIQTRKEKVKEAVQSWRRRTKERIVQAFGGACGICGYNKCTDSLALHHLNPKEKDFSLGKIRANIISWQRIVLELRKCVMICHNCHSEVHNGITKVPSNINRFDESYADYKKLEEKQKMDECPICGTMKPIYQITCSYECAAKRSYTVDWDNFDLKRHLVDLKMSYVDIADKLGVSDGSVRKRAKKLGLSSLYEKSA